MQDFILGGGQVKDGKTLPDYKIPLEAALQFGGNPSRRWVGTQGRGDTDTSDAANGDECLAAPR